MVSQRRLLNLLTMVILLSLFAVACERPLGGTGDGATDDQTNQTEDTNSGGGTDGSGEVTTTGDTTEAVTTDTTTEVTEATTSDSGAVDTTGESTDTTTDATAPQDDSSEAGGGVGDATTDSGDATQTTEDETAVQDTATTEESSTDNATSDEPATATTVVTSTTTIPATHTVAAGENLYRIGLKYGTSWVAIANTNGLANPNILSVGQVLKLPGATPTTPDPTPSPQTETTYIVQTGDNLFRIGLKFGISWVQIAEANGIVNPNMIAVGTELKIPIDTPGPVPQFSHVVKAGETLFLISLQYGVAWPTIAEANNIASPYIIYVGQTLEIPGSQ